MTNALGFSVLSITAYVPIVGALLIMFLFSRQRPLAIKWFAFGVSLISLFFSLFMIPYFEPSNVQMQFVERAEWIPSIGVQYFFGIDGISLPLIILTTLLSSVAVLCSFSNVGERQKEYYVSLLILETGMLGVFMALDVFLFYVFWEVMLVPMVFPHRHLGGTEEDLRRHQVLSLHTLRERPPPPGFSGPLLPKRKPRLRLRRVYL